MKSLVRLVDHVVEHSLPNLGDGSFWLPHGLLADFSFLVVEVQPVPLVVPLGISSKLVELHLLFMVAAFEERIELRPAPIHLKHALLFSTLLKRFTRLPTLSSRNFVGLHLQSVLLDPSVDVQAPVIPHWWSRPDDVVRLRVEPRQILHSTVILLVFSILLPVSLLLPDQRWSLT